MKRMTAKELLAESFRELAGQKSIDKITIRDITENCGYSTATFYRQFKDKYDLIAWTYTRDLEKIVGQNVFDQSSWKRTLFDAANYYGEHKVYLANLFRHTSGYDSFIQNMTEIHYTCLKNQILKSSHMESLDEKTEMYIRVYVHGTVRLSCEWILGQYACDTGTLAEIYEETLPTPLLSLLCVS